MSGNVRYRTQTVRKPRLSQTFFGNSRFIHSIVPITDATGSRVTRLFLCSEKVE